MKKYYVKYGISTAALLILYFLVTKLIGWHQYPILSAFNAVLFGGGILLATKKFKSDSNSFKYADGFQVGILTGAIATLLFTAFMAVYIYQFDDQFANAILDSWGLDFNEGTLIILVSVILMGLSTSFVLTLAFMQLLKESWNPKP